MAKQKERPTNFFDAIENFVDRSKKLSTKKVEYHGMNYSYGRVSRNGGYYQTKSNPFKKLSSDEVKIRKGVASYYLWGKLIAKWNGEELWLTNAKCESITVSRRLSFIYAKIFDCNYGGMKTENDIDLRDYSNSAFDKRIQFFPEGYTLGRSVHIINSYPITLSKETGEILDFSKEQRKMYIAKFLRSRSNRGNFILSTIQAFGFELSKEDKANIKSKQLKLFMDSKTGQGNEKDNFLSNTLALI